MKKILCSIGLILTIALTSCTQNIVKSAVQINIENGTIEGFVDSEKDLHLFLGIPFTKPPVGDLRWSAPQPADNWDGVLETKKFGPRPVQANVFGDMRFRSETMSEDCLYLNVWTPADNKGNLPVLVYFYGGGFVAGAGCEPRYDGASMAQKGMVAVTVNYRLNIFGFFAHPELSAEASYKGSGNYGLLDQNMALQWVQKNIAAFGGDPNKVTIAGESAGSISVSAQMVSPLSKDLIAGAIGESGAAINPTLFPVPLTQAEQEGQDFAEKAGYTSLAELRALSTDEIFAVYNKSQRFGFSTVIDGYFYPKSLPEIFNAGEQAQIPLLLGWNSAEIPGMGFMQGLPYTKENFIKKVKETFPNEYEQVLQVYQHDTPREVELSATALASDRFIAYATWKWFDLHRKNSEQPVYRYLYSKLRPPLVDQNRTAGLAGGTMEKDENAPAMPEAVGAPHACEIEYCLGNLPLIHEYAWTDDDYKVSKTMQTFFANFILTGNPNGDDVPEWSAAKPNDDTPPVMVIDVESKTVNAQHDARYEILDQYYGND